MNPTDGEEEENMGVVSKKATQNITFLSSHFRRNFSGISYSFSGQAKVKFSLSDESIPRFSASSADDEEREKNIS